MTFYSLFLSLSLSLCSAVPVITPIRPMVIGLVNTEVTIGITIRDDYPLVMATQITWYHESDLTTPLTSSPGGRYTFSNEMQSLTINELSYADEGNYTAIVSHVTGSQSIILNINVQGELVLVSIVWFLKVSKFGPVHVGEKTVTFLLVTTLSLFLSL